MPQFTPTLFRQMSGESWSDIPRHGDGPKHVCFRHVMHPYFDRAVPFNNTAQEITFETIRIAAAAAPYIATRTVCVTLEEEAHIVPPDFLAVPALDRFVYEVGQFAHLRPLPLLFDGLDHGLAAPIAPAGGEEYVVFTNSDIHLMPHFYRSIAKLIADGYDVITTNRRVLPHYAGGIDDLPLMFADYGKDHVGYDCFVFPARLYADFVKSDACVGAAAVMRSLLFNLAALAERFLMLTTAHLTFHIGDDSVWTDGKYADYRAFNVEQAERVAAGFAAQPVRRARLDAYRQASGEQG
jgi:hypothetical protein